MVTYALFDDREYKRLSREEVIEELKKLDREDTSFHIQADELLLMYIYDEEIKDLYELLPKWYS